MMNIIMKASVQSIRYEMEREKLVKLPVRYPYKKKNIAEIRMFLRPSHIA